MLTILHGSDLQCGTPYRLPAAEAFQAAARALDPDVVVIAGDLTQRAKPREYRAVREYLRGFGSTPVVVTPGNHDVPLYRFWERLAAPYRNWRRYVDASLDVVTRVEGAVIVALNSSAPRRAIVGGRLDSAQLEFAERALNDAAPDDARVLVVHHHFVPTAGDEGGRPLPNARRLLERFEAMGVDLVLGGHIHQTRIETSRTLIPEGEGPGIVLVRCGTTASSRGRGREAGRNSFNIVRIAQEEVEVLPHLSAPGSERFEAQDPRRFPRPVAAGSRDAP